MKIKQHSVDANFYTFREYDYLHVPSSTNGPRAMEKMMIRASGQKHDLFKLADRCMEIWHEFLKVNGLPTSIDT